MIVLLALGIGGYFVARAQAINASAHAELEILRMTAAHNAEMFAFRERLQKIDAQIAATRANIEASARKPTSPTIKSGTRTPVGTRTSSVRNTGHRPTPLLHAPHDALDDLDSTDPDPLGGLEPDAPAPRRKRPRLE